VASGCRRLPAITTTAGSSMLSSRSISSRTGRLASLGGGREGKVAEHVDVVPIRDVQRQSFDSRPRRLVSQTCPWRAPLAAEQLMASVDKERQLALARGVLGTPGAAVIFDIDGVLADAAGRQHYLDWGDWHSFFDCLRR
jgi:hypothetical protein